MKWYERFDQSCAPEMSDIEAFIGTPHFASLRVALCELYGISPKVEYSRCGMDPGWNVKFKKGGKAICALYPDDGVFRCLLSLPDVRQNEIEHALLSCAPARGEQYRAAGPYLGGRWICYDVACEQDVRDTIALVTAKLPPNVKWPARAPV